MEGWEGTSSIRRRRSLMELRTDLMFCPSVVPFGSLLFDVVFCDSAASLTRFPNSLIS